MKFFLFFSKKSLTAPSGFGKLVDALTNSALIFNISVQHAILDCSQALPMFGITSKVSVFTSQTSKCSAHTVSPMSIQHSIKDARKSPSVILVQHRRCRTVREWLSWWSTTLPRSGPRVRVPSRALIKNGDTFRYLHFLLEHWNRDGTTYPGWRSHGGMFPWLPSRECCKEGPACGRIPCCHGAACAKRISCSAFPSHQKKLRFIESELSSLFFFVHPANFI